LWICDFARQIVECMSSVVLEVFCIWRSVVSGIFCGSAMIVQLCWCSK